MKHEFRILVPTSAEPLATFSEFSDAQNFILKQFGSTNKAIYKSDCYYWTNTVGDFNHYDARITVYSLCDGRLVPAKFTASPDWMPGVDDFCVEADE